MKRKEEESIIRKTVHSSMSAVKKFIIGSEVGRAVDDIKREVEETIEDTKQKINDLINHITIRLISISFISVGALIAFIGLGILLSELFDLSISTTFLLVGLIVIIIGLLGLRKVFK